MPPLELVMDVGTGTATIELMGATDREARRRATTVIAMHIPRDRTLHRLPVQTPVARPRQPSYGR